MVKFLNIERIFIKGYFLIFLLSNSPFLFSVDQLVFSQSDDIIGIISKNVLNEAYNRIGIKILSEIFPAERALSYSNSGQTDGEINRIKGVDIKYRNLMFVPVCINTAEFMVFSKKHDLIVTGWESLKSYKIGIRIGTKIVERNTAGMNVITASSNDRLIRMLAEDMCDVVVLSRSEGANILKNSNAEDIKILEPPIANVKLFHYLHKDNISILPEITKALEEMEAEGRIEEIRNEFITELLNGF